MELQFSNQIIKTLIKMNSNHWKNRLNGSKMNFKTLSKKVILPTDNQPVINEPLKEVTFQELIKENLPVIFPKIKKFEHEELNFDKPSSIRGCPDDFSCTITSQNTSRVQQILPHPAPSEVSCRVPTVRVISVEMPPVREGFGF